MKIWDSVYILWPKHILAIVADQPHTQCKAGEIKYAVVLKINWLNNLDWLSGAQYCIS